MEQKQEFESGILNRDLIERYLKKCPPHPNLIKILGRNYLGSAEYHWDGHGNIKIRLNPKLGVEVE